ncbi:MAG: hypothetical protein ACXWUG_20080 [Polyangiales bacterium]
MISRLPSLHDEPTPALGSFIGTPLVAGCDWFNKTYGAKAASEVVARIPERWADLVRADRPSLGILGARRYPYAFVGDLVYTMRVVAQHPDEDRLIHDLAVAGIDGSTSTVMRWLARWMATPRMIAARSQESWSTFHDTGRVTVLSITDHEYLRKVTEWHGHDVIVCKITMEVAAHAIALTGAKNVRGRREGCAAWGHDGCVARIRWD